MPSWSGNGDAGVGPAYGIGEPIVTLHAKTVRAITQRDAQAPVRDRGPGYICERGVERKELHVWRCSPRQRHRARVSREIIPAVVRDGKATCNGDEQVGEIISPFHNPRLVTGRIAC